MPENIRSLIVVTVLALIAFYLGRQVTRGIITPREFKVWRNVWFAATTAGFLSGSFFIYAIIVVVLVLYARAERAFYPSLFVLLLFVVPPIQVTIGGFNMINKLMEVSNPGLLAALILLPALMSMDNQAKRANGGQIADFLIISYVLLMLALQFRSAGVTHVTRMTCVYSLNILLPYFALSRAVTTPADVRKVLAAFVIAAFPMSVVAVFEVLRGWYLYYSIGYEWVGSGAGAYIERSGMLRASASAANPIALGFIIMVVLGCLVALQHRLRQNVARIGFALLCAGLIASLSRGPWVGAATLVIVYLITGPNAVTKVAKLAALGSMLMLILLPTPIGAKLVDFLPFVGSVDAANVEYRQRLITNAFAVAERRPWFGAVDYRSAPEMQEMIQGQGIIDVVNSYLGVLLEYGIVGLTLFVGFFASILLALWRSLRAPPASDPELQIFLRASIATLVGILVTIGTVSSVSYIPHVYWSFAGLCVALVRITRAQRVAEAFQLSPSKIAA